MLTRISYWAAILGGAFCGVALAPFVAYRLFAVSDIFRWDTSQTVDVAGAIVGAVLGHVTWLVSAGRRTPLHLSEADLENRRPVWLAISELFLDTSHDSTDLDRIAKVLAGSPYSVEELDQILLWEVYPACFTNFLSIAGEWSGFDPDWLESRILRGRTRVARLWLSSVGRLGRFASSDWRAVRRCVELARTSGRQADHSPVP